MTMLELSSILKMTSEVIKIIRSMRCSSVYNKNDNLHCKKGQQFSRPQPGYHFPNSPWLVIIIPAGEFGK